MSTPPPPPPDLRESILRYLAEHEQAADTIEGIAEWWLERARVRVEVERVWSVVRQLVAEGRLEDLGAGRYGLPRGTPGSIVSQERLPG